MDIGQIIKRVWDTFVKIQSTCIIWDMVIQSFLILGYFWQYLPISFQGYGILYRQFKGIWDITDPPSSASKM